MIGKTISHYKILEKLGSGGMGIVYTAQDLDLDRTVVLKFLPTELNVDRDAKKRFIREAKAASKLDHINICTIHEIGETPTGQIYIAMAYYEGETLKEVLKRGSLDLETAFDYVIQITRGLEIANQFGIIHRDMKPANLIITPQGIVKIIDFGLAKISSDKDVTQTRSSAGTIAYMSPQQICAEPLDPGTDIWSVGIILYEMLTGRLPFQGDYEPTIIFSILSEEPTPVSQLKSDCTQELDRVIFTAIAKNPNDRYTTPGLLRNDLESLKHCNLENLSFVSGKDTKYNFWLVNGFHKLLFRVRASGLLAAILSIVIIIFLLTILFLNKPNIAQGVVVIDEIAIEGERTDQDSDLANMLKYLLMDDLMQSSYKNILTDHEFKSLNPHQNPEIRLNIKLSLLQIGFDLNAKIIEPSLGYFSRSEDLHFTVYDPGYLLSDAIPQISNRILKSQKKNSSFTTSWDAFVNLYRGEMAWQKLEVSVAKNFFENALEIDPGFVLAKLRLANMLPITENLGLVRKMVKDIIPHSSLLSVIDSLRAEALLARTSDNSMKEINILRTIYNKFPLRKENSYEVAEAYFQICDSPNAIKYYNKSLAIDPNFSLAHNHLAYCYSRKGDHKKALHHFHKYLTLDNTANAYDSIGEGFMAAGILDSAEVSLKIGISMDSTLSYLYGNLFEIYCKQGKIKDALHTAEKYIRYSDSDDSRARGFFMKAYAEFLRDNLDTAFRYCKHALDLYDARDVFSRNHELHWLLARLYLGRNFEKAFSNEIDEMSAIIKQNKINANNYRQGIFKFYLHSKACAAAVEGNLTELLEIIQEFDGPLRYKVYDWGSQFDLAYFNTCFADLLIQKPIQRYDLAEKRLKKALTYNNNYALAYYHLFKLNELRGESDKSTKNAQKFLQLWRDADKDLAQIKHVLSIIENPR